MNNLFDNNILKKNVNSFLWVVPFVCFLLGYQLLSYLYSPKILKVPQVVGLNLQDVISSLSKLNLNTRILAQKIDPDLPEGIVLSQTPDSGENIKSYQSIYLVVTKQPPKEPAPLLQDKKLHEVNKVVKDKNIYLKNYYINNNSLKDICIAQNPSASELLDNKSMTAYFSNGSESVRIFPLLKNRSFKEVKEFLESYDIKYKLLYKDGKEPNNQDFLNCKVIDQRPLAGSIVNISKVINVQLVIQSN